MMAAAEAPASPVFGMPRVPRTIISRPRLSHMIDGLLSDHDLVIIKAPSGSGKTVALADWAASGITPGHITWVTMDERYVDPTSFWREMILGTAPRVDRSVLPLVTECAEALVAGVEPRTVLRRIIPYVPEMYVVIDRFDFVRDEGLINDMIWILQQCRSIKAAVVTVRSKLSLDMCDMALALDMVVVGPEPFNLTVKEMEQLMELRGCSMEHTSVHAATGGHPLLTRATMAVYDELGVGNIGDYVETAVSDFLRLSLAKAKLGKETQEFMVRTSVAESFTVDLALQLSGVEDVDDLLEVLQDLEDQGLGLWFRNGNSPRFQYAAAVRVLLQKSLKQLDPREIDRLARIVIEHDLSFGNAVSALRQAVAIGDLDMASRIACDHHMTLLVAQAQVVLGVLEAVPATRLRRHPSLIMALALCHNAIPNGGVKATEYFALAISFAQIYMSSMDPGQRIWMLALQSSAYRFAGKLEPAMKYSKLAVQSFEESPLELQEQLYVLEPTLYTQAAIAHIHDQQFEDAQELLVKALVASRRAGSAPSVFHATGLLAFTLVLAGKTGEARTQLGWLKHSRWPPGMMDGYWATAYRLAQVREAMDRQSWKEAIGYLELVNDQMQASEFWPYMVAYTSLLDLQRNGPASGPVTLEARIRQAHRAPLNSSGQIDLNCLRATIHLVAGQPAKASAAVSKYTKPAPRVLIMRARVALYQGDSAKALKLTGQPEHCLGPRLEVQRLLLRSAALQRLGDTDGARDNAHAAASMMATNGLSMTNALIPQEDLPALERYVHDVAPEIPKPQEIIPSKVKAAYLTPRELVVLNTFAVHGSANDVAQILSVSVNTVKSQRRSILKKLGAKTLEEALTTARRQRLLED
jgi:LuxR family maltose regulon positive regulatory protein